jgi:hypothetical protein
MLAIRISVIICDRVNDVIATVRTDPFIFRGNVSEAGYEWLKGEDGKPRLVPRHIPGTSFRTSEPHKALFLKFAKMAPTREEIQSFADLHGDLFSRYELKHSAARMDRTAAHGASFRTWTQEIGDMRVLVVLWENIQHRQLSTLKRVVKWSEKEVGYILKTPRRERDVILAHADIPGTGLSRFRPRDVLLPARCALQLEINLRLAEYPAVPRLTWTPDTPGCHQRIIIEPSNLLSAMWLQFAQAVTGEFQLRLCECGCGRYFQVGPGGRRADATTFDGACRQRKNRRKEK